jgi:hypothetical protein
MRGFKNKPLGSELERGIISLRFFLCLTGTAVMVILGAWGKLFLTEEVKETGLAAGYHLTVVISALKSETAVFMIPIISTLPFSGSFLEEHRSRFERLLLIRSGRKRYVIGKILITGISGSLGILAGILLVTGIFSVIYGSMEAADAKASSDLLMELLKYCTVTALLGNLWSSLGALLGIVYRNFYMAYGGPFLINYFLIIIFSRYVPSIYVLNPREWLMQEHYPSDNPLGIILFLAEICIILQLLEGMAILNRIRET